MPPKKIIDADYIIVDLNSKKRDELLLCMYKYITKKAISKQDTKSQDVYKLSVVGSEETNNELNHKYISTISDWQYYNEEDVVDINKQIEGVKGDRQANIFEAIYLGVHHLANDQQVANHAFKRVIVFSDLSSKPPQNITSLTKDLQKFLSSCTTWLYVCGPQVRTPYLEGYEDIQRWSRIISPADKSDINLVQNLNAIRDMLYEGVVADFDVGLHLLFYYKPDLKPPYPWYGVLLIGDIEIKINVVKLVHKEHEFTFNEEEDDKNVEDGEDVEEDENVMKNPDTGELVYDAVAGYQIHDRCIVISAEKEKEDVERSAENDDKLFEIKYFMDKNVLTGVHFEEDSLSTVVSDIRESESDIRESECTMPLDVIAEAMQELGVAAMVKRVYAKGPQFRPKPYVMFICPNHGSTCLLLARWPFASDLYGDVPHVQSHTKPEFKPLDETLKSAVDNFLLSVTIDREDLIDNGKALYCLPEYAMQNVNVMSQCEFLVKARLNPEFSAKERMVKEYTRHPELKLRSREFLEKLKEVMPKDLDDDLDLVKFDKQPEDDVKDE